jgi:DNA-binding transcriptional ArsR family regulator
MGKLRTEPKVKPFLDDQEYREYLELLRDAKQASNDNFVYYDLESGEKPRKVRKALLHVAEKEGISLRIRRERGTNSLGLSFREKGKSSTRMSAEESRQRILKALGDAKEPQQKSQIISATGISPSTWNIRIKELMEAGKVKRMGDRRDTKYLLK